MSDIKQLISFKNVVFKEGDVLKITIEVDGTKNLYVGKFLYFRKKGYFKWRTFLVFRHHTLCQEGLFEIEDNDITNIEKLECKK